MCCCIFCCQCSLVKRNKYEQGDLPMEDQSQRKAYQFDGEEITDFEVKTNGVKRKNKKRLGGMAVEEVSGGEPNISPMIAYPGGFPP